MKIKAQVTKVMKLLVSITITLLSLCAISFSSIGKSEEDVTGQQIFERNCVQCHDADGTRGRWGAKNLKQSKLSDQNMLNIISNGKGIMPAWSKSLSEVQIRLVRDYIKTLRK